MDDQELINIVQAKVTGSVGYMGNMLNKERLKAEQYYKGEPFGDEIAGQSQVVSRDVAEAVDSALPSLMKIFASSESLGEFQPRSPKADKPGEPPGSGAMRAEKEAQQATDYVNWVFWSQNDGFLILHNWFKDALLKKLGVVKSWWDESEDVTKETYQGLTDVELAMLRADPEIEIVSQETKEAQLPPIMAMVGAQMGPQSVASLHDVVCRRTKKKGRIRIAVVPPDEFLIDHRAVTVEEAPFKAHRRKATVSELIEMGFDKNVVENLAPDSSQDFNPEKIERFKDEDAYPYRSDNFTDPSMREVWITEAYINVDFDDDGIGELRKVTVVGESTFDLLGNEETDDHPFSTLTPIPMPHKVFGMSMADQTQDIQEIKSALWRGALNGLYLQNAPRYGIVDGKVNLDDLLDVRPGSAVRMKDPGAIVPLATEPVSEVVFQAIEYADNVRETRTGVRRFNSTLKADQINPYSQTATGAQIMEDASKDRLLLIARIFAQTGVAHLFKRIFELVCKHQQAPEIIRLRNQWVPMDPREWSTNMDLQLVVGLGTGDKSAQLARALGLSPLIEQMIQLQGGPSGPMLTWQNLYNYGRKVVELSELKDTELYLTDPSTQPPSQPRPDPKAMESQAKVQLMGAQAQAVTQKAQIDQQAAQQALQVKAAEHQMDMQQTQEKGRIEMQVQAAQAQQEAQTEQDRLRHDIISDAIQTQSRMALEQQESHNDMALQRMKTEEGLKLKRAEFEEKKKQGAYKPQPKGKPKK